MTTPDNQTEAQLVDLLIINAHVVTMDHAYREFNNGAVAVIGSQIVDVGPTCELQARYRAVEVVDASRKILLPGLVNAHTHSPLTIFRGLADDLALTDWLYNHIFPAEKTFVNPTSVRLGTELAIAEMLRSGTTTFNEMYYHTDIIAEVADKTGMRAILTEAVIDEPVRNANAPTDVFRFSEEMILKWNNHPRISFGVALHAPYTVHSELYRKGKELADKYKTILHTHVAETKWEFDMILNKHGSTPVKYLEEIGILDKNLVAAHAIHVTPSDIDLLAKYNVGIVHNPQCNMKLASGIAPVSAMISQGINVALGTDGAASNNDLDLFDEMRTSALAQKHFLSDPTVMDSRTVVGMATISGAKVLGLERSIGSIEPGKQADLILLALDFPHCWPNYNVYSLIVYSLRGSDVHSVMVDGKWLVKNRKMLCINEEHIYTRLSEMSKNISDWKTNRELNK